MIRCRIWPGLAAARTAISVSRRHLSATARGVDAALRGVVQKETVQRLRQYGYAVVDDVFGEDLCRAFRQEIEGMQAMVTRCCLLLILSLPGG